MTKKAQASIEFALAFVCTILFIIFACNLFVWMGINLVRRQDEYGKSRVAAGSKSSPGKTDFFTPPKLNVFNLGGR